MIPAHALAQLRHAYAQLAAGSVSDQQGFARGLLGSAIEALEQAQRMPAQWAVMCRNGDAEAGYGSRDAAVRGVRASNSYCAACNATGHRIAPVYLGETEEP